MLPENVLTRITQLPGVRTLWQRFPVGPLDLRVRFGISPRPNYAYGVHAAANLAVKLGIPAMSVIEFGVAGGKGLVALENIAAEVSQALGIEIAVYGFDSGEGMPSPKDYRDIGHVWGAGFYKMDQAALRASLKRATLVLGDVAETVPRFRDEENRPPVGFVSFDLDYYSSTKVAFQLFEGAFSSRLPRVYCYFDDIVWPEIACHNEFTGELCAIREFNAEHEYQKICPIHLLAHTRPHPAPWNEQMYVAHDFRHPLYTVNLVPKSESHTALPL